MEQQPNQQFAMRISKVTILWNILLSLLKLLAGIFAHSGAMLSDAVHSASDVFSTVIVMIGVKAAGKQADREHPYGHERLECVAALLLAILLFATGSGIGISGLQKIIHQGNSPLPIPGCLALMAAVLSIAVKEGMYWYTRNGAKKINSGALMADAWHHRSDALSSVGSFLGIMGARLGFPVLDPAASVVICLLVIKAAASIFIDSIDKMIDKACDCKTVQLIEEEILAQPGVLGIDQMNTRMFADRIYVDVEIRADGEASLNCSHEIAQRVHDAVESRFPRVKHCMVHMNPGKIE